MTANWTRRGLGLVSLCALAALLHAAGGTLASPPLDPGDLTTWWTAQGPVMVLASLVRVAALVGTSWLAVITAVDCVAVAVRLGPLQRLTRRAVPAVWRNLVLRPLALSAIVAPQVLIPAATMSIAAAEPIEAPAEAGDQTQDELEIEIEGAEGDRRRVLEMHKVGPPPPVAVMSRVELPPESRSGVTGPGESGHDARQEVESGADAASEAESVPFTRVISMTMHPTATGPDDPTPAPQATQAGPIHVVASGENLWSIAASHLAAESDTPVTTAEVGAYWQRLIDGNRQVLPDPDNPDLLYRGVELQLPPTG